MLKKIDALRDHSGHLQGDGFLGFGGLTQRLFRFTTCS